MFYSVCIQLVLPAMKTHPRQLGVQMAATACLYNLSKAELGQKVHPVCLREIVELTLLAMENFPNHQQLQKNALLTLCSDRILQDVVCTSCLQKFVVLAHLGQRLCGPWNEENLPMHYTEIFSAVKMKILVEKI